MTIEKTSLIDQVEVTEIGIVQVRTATRFTENDILLSKSFHRHIVAPGDDYSAEDARVQAICAATHTADVIAAYKAASAAKGV